MRSKGAPSRESHTERIKEVNRLMKDFCAREARMSFIDVFNPLQKDGKSQPELFLSDRLHLNEKGYAIWQEAIAPYLIKP